MKRIFIVSYFIISLCGSVTGQNLTDSNLPIVIINTDLGVEIQDDPKVLASMKIIFRGQGERNYITDQDNTAYLNYNGRIGIELRGSSTQESPKKQYGFTTTKADGLTNNNVSLLGMPSENDWILNGMAFDTTYIRDFLCYNLSGKLGNYASRTAYCEVIINNDYKGLYVLQEKIKAGKDRVDVIKIGSSDNNLPEVTGGYITKADKANGDPVAWTMYSHTGSPVDYIHVLPKPENATTQQTEYIKSGFLRLGAAAKDGNSSLINGYPSMIDISSFIDFMIINELASNVDAYSYSTFFHKDRNGKLRAGPVWDFDLTFGNDLFFMGYDRSKTEGWYFQDNQLDGSTFWIDLFNDNQFRCYLSKRWNELIQPGQPLNPSGIEEFIDQTVATINEGVARDFVRWSRIGTYHQQIEALKTFLNERIAWMTSNIGSFSSCSNVILPPLVITKIMYHPAPSVEFPDGNALEFIEITNNGDETINLTGIQFNGTGLVYQFPVNASVSPGSSLYLASNASAFQSKYGFAPFGQFTRNLSDKSQKLVLTDGFCNIIDNVVYYNTSPWPDANGNGNFLELTDPDLDNNMAENWIASNYVSVSVENINSDFSLLLYPNPVMDKLTIQASSEIISVSLFDLQGQVLIMAGVGCESYELDLSHFAKGTYVLRVTTGNKSYSRRVVKK